jgi:hypothetical protein
MPREPRYASVTNDHYHRVMQQHEIEGFTERYKIDRLVYYKEFQYVETPSAEKRRSHKDGSMRKDGPYRARQSHLGGPGR